MNLLSICELTSDLVEDVVGEEDAEREGGGKEERSSRVRQSCRAER